jgi:hypothetical protein
LEMYLEKTLGRGLPPLWEQKMLFDATKAYDAYYKEEGNTPRPAPRPPDEKQQGQQPPASGGFESKVLEKLEGMNRSIDGLHQSQDHLKGNFSRLDGVVKALQRGEEPPGAGGSRGLPGEAGRCECTQAAGEAGLRAGSVDGERRAEARHADGASSHASRC